MPNADDITKTDRTVSSLLTVAEPGIPPPNGLVVLPSASMLLEFYDVKHLRDPRFCKAAPHNDTSAKVSELDALEKTRTTVTTVKKESDSKTAKAAASVNTPLDSAPTADEV